MLTRGTFRDAPAHARAVGARIGQRGVARFTGSPTHPAGRGIVHLTPVILAAPAGAGRRIAPAQPLVAILPVLTGRSVPTTAQSIHAPVRLGGITRLTGRAGQAARRHRGGLACSTFTASIRAGRVVTLALRAITTLPNLTRSQRPAHAHVHLAMVGGTRADLAHAALRATMFSGGGDTLIVEAAPGGTGIRVAGALPLDALLSAGAGTGTSARTRPIDAAIHQRPFTRGAIAAVGSTRGAVIHVALAACITTSRGTGLRVTHALLVVAPLARGTGCQRAALARAALTAISAHGSAIHARATIHAARGGGGDAGQEALAGLAAAGATGLITRAAGARAMQPLATRR